MKRLAITTTTALSACGRRQDATVVTRSAQPLYPNETPELRALVNKYAGIHDIPASLIQRKSDYRPAARNGPYYGLMQILPETGPASDLLNAETNLIYADKYLRGAWLVSDGNEATAVSWYARGYYYEAKRRGAFGRNGPAPSLNDSADQTAQRIPNEHILSSQDISPAQLRFLRATIT